MDTLTSLRVVALMQFLDCDFDDIGEGFRDSAYSYGGQEYLVLTEDEADAAFDEALENILDDVILPDLDEALQCYFDRDAWKRDTQYDGRGHHLNHYDGEEYEEVVNGTSYYIYRVN